jgi:uncharacterized membrane protein (GlpM family)
MAILLIKLLLVPLLIATVTLAGRRWGQDLAGWLGSFPIVAGPILLIVALENGNAFGAGAAQAALAGVSAAMIFYVAYARLADRLRWWATLPLALLIWAGTVLLLQRLPTGLAAAVIVAIVSLALAPRAMGRRALPLLQPAPHPLELPARMAVGALLVFTTSEIAARFGPRASGFGALFPVIGAVVAGFNHAAHGPASAAAFLQGMTRGMWSVAAFCIALVVGLPRLSLALAFTCAIAATVATHAAMRPARRVAA